MSLRGAVSGIGFFALCCCAASAAYCGNDAPGPGKAAAVGTLGAQQLAQVVPGRSTKAQIRSLLGTPWRIVQFNDCGEAMDDQADETWEYRGRGPNGDYRIHIEFDDRGIAHLVAKIPDRTPGGKATAAKLAPAKKSAGGMTM
jgi:hypothetical protein